LHVCAFSGRSNERRSVFGQADFKYQQFLKIHLLNLSDKLLDLVTFLVPPLDSFCLCRYFSTLLWNVPSMASTMPSLRTSKDPEQTKCCACRASPWRIRYSPGAQKEVLMCKDSERRHPLLAEEKRGSCRMSLFRCMAMSARNSSGKSCKS